MTAVITNPWSEQPHSACTLDSFCLPNRSSWALLHFAVVPARWLAAQEEGSADEPLPESLHPLTACITFPNLLTYFTSFFSCRMRIIVIGVTS